MTGPVRVRLSRKAGWRLPPNTISVARPSRLGNHYRVGRDGDQAACVAKFRTVWEAGLTEPEGSLHRALYVATLAQIRGKNLACWCAPDAPCHADVLLELANR